MMLEVSMGIACPPRCVTASDLAKVDVLALSPSLLKVLGLDSSPSFILFLSGPERLSSCSEVLGVAFALGVGGATRASTF
eukprot:6626447-Heterocapsa_arctica.AAC.1